MTASIIQPGEIQPAGVEAPFILLPDNDVFSRRSERFDFLAQGHAMTDYLQFMAHIAAAQHTALSAMGALSLPEAEQLNLCRQHGMPPLTAQSWPRDRNWQLALLHIVSTVQGAARQATRSALERLAKADSSWLEAQAGHLLAGRYEQLDLAAAPFVGAALQVYWVAMATALGESAFGRTDNPTLCPVCASAPVASVVRIGGEEQGLRYLHCSLCETEWHMVRVKCSSCESTKGIAYFSVEGSSGAVKAETCDECHSYLKIMYMERDHLVDPVADDLATLALDILLDEKGYMRSGPNLLLIPAGDSPT